MVHNAWPLWIIFNLRDKAMGKIHPSRNVDRNVDRHCEHQPQKKVDWSNFEKFPWVFTHRKHQGPWSRLASSKAPREKVMLANLVSYSVSQAKYD